MGGHASRSRDRTAAKSLAVVEELLRNYLPRDFAVEFCDGSRIPPDAGQLLGLHGLDERLNLAAELVGQLHSKSRDRQAVTFHYDISNKFYAFWLDLAG